MRVKQNPPRAHLLLKRLQSSMRIGELPSAPSLPKRLLSGANSSAQVPPVRCRDPATAAIIPLCSMRRLEPGARVRIELRHWDAGHRLSARVSAATGTCHFCHYAVPNLSSPRILLWWFRPPQFLELLLTFSAIYLQPSMQHVFRMCPLVNLVFRSAPAPCGGPAALGACHGACLKSPRSCAALCWSRGFEIHTGSLVSGDHWSFYLFSVLQPGRYLQAAVMNSRKRYWHFCSFWNSL